MSLCLGETKITPCIHSALLQDKNITITENGTQSVVADNQYNGLGQVTINTNVGGLQENDVTFYDYDGTILYSYSKLDFLALQSMPENPSHEGLIAQGWNWDLADAKTHVTKYGILDVGQVYTTASGLSEFDIELNAQTGLTINLMIDGTKNWGDGTSDDLTTHTYSSAGKYTITCNGTGITPSSSNNNICDIAASNGSHNFYINNIRITNISSLPNYSFTNLRNLKTIIISNDTTAIGDYCFQNTRIKHLTLPKNFNKISKFMCASNFYLESVSLGKGTYLYYNTTNVFAGCNNLRRAIIPNTNFNERWDIQNNIFSNNLNMEKYKCMGRVGSIGSYAFSNCINVKEFDFTKGRYNTNTILTLYNVNAFQNINPLIAKIVVPDNLYEDWIVASNWTAYADIIVKESDYNA